MHQGYGNAPNFRANSPPPPQLIQAACYPGAAPIYRLTETTNHDGSSTRTVLVKTIDTTNSNINDLSKLKHEFRILQLLHSVQSSSPQMQESGNTTSSFTPSTITTTTKASSSSSSVISSTNIPNNLTNETGGGISAPIPKFLRNLSVINSSPSSSRSSSPSQGSLHHSSSSDLLSRKLSPPSDTTTWIQGQLRIPKPYSLSVSSQQFTMEDIGGIPLPQYVATFGLTLMDVLTLAIQLTEALEYIHDLDMIHLGIRPDSIFVAGVSGISGGLRLQLVDFGLATTMTHEDENPEWYYTTEVLPYISPEQCGRMNRSVDHRTDFYSMGVVLYELLIGSLPWKAFDSMVRKIFIIFFFILLLIKLFSFLFLILSFN